MNQLKDEGIIDLFWHRDESAIAETDAAYGRFLFILSDRILQNREDAEENVSDTYLRTWQVIPPHRPRYFQAFLSKICRHLAFDRLDWKLAAKRNAEVVSLSQEMEQCIPDTAAQRKMEAREIGQILEGFLGSLSLEKRCIFLRRYLYMDTVSQISQRYGMTESKVKMQLHRIRTQLRMYLEKEGICV